MLEEQNAGGSESEENFAAMLEQSLVKRQKLEPGQVVEARIVKVSDEWVFLDLGGKGEGYIDKKEVLDESGAPTVKEGDTIRAYYLSTKNNELLFTTRIGSGPAVKNQLEDAWKSGIPVEGAVAKEVKGGFEVRIGSVRAFCPFSQMGLGRSEDKASLINKSLQFKITEYDEKGRNIVVSRRPILEEERQKARTALRETLQEGMRVKGTVTSLQKFGAFVNIGGIEGLLPISEVAWGRTEKIQDVLSLGQVIEVVIKKLDWEADRFSFSLKDVLSDPWESVAGDFPAGSFHAGKVSRLAPFGAFVTLKDGIDGLIHISKLGGEKRISHPREVLKEGQDVEVKVEAVDPAARKLSLSLAETSRAEEEAAATLREYKQGEAAAPKSLGSLGELLKAQMEKKKN
jgi:small subunit ribosomal protein S1